MTEKDKTDVDKESLFRGYDSKEDLVWATYLINSLI